MTAIASANDLQQAVENGELTKVENNQPPVIIFFPEIIPAALGVLVSPYWAFSLASGGYILAGLGVLLVAAGGVYGFARCMKRNHRWAADFVLAGIILAFVGIYNVTPEALSPLGQSSDCGKSCGK